MKTTIKMVLAAAVITLSACSKDEVKTQSNFPSDGIIRVATNVDSPTTRAGMTTDNINKFSININNETSVKYSYYGFFTKALDVWSCFSDEEAETPLTMLWQNSTTKVKVTALSYTDFISETDFNDINTAYEIQLDQSNAANLQKSDILYYKTKEVNPNKDLTDAGELPIAFEHLLSKINISITLGSEFNTVPGTTTNPISELLVYGTKTIFFWNALTDNSFYFDSFPPADITPLAGTYSGGSGTTTKAVAKYEMILVPQDVAANGFTVSFVINDKPYSWSSAEAISLARNTQYSLELVVGKDIVTLGGFTASKWTNNTGKEAETE